MVQLMLMEVLLELRLIMMLASARMILPSFTRIHSFLLMAVVLGLHPECSIRTSLCSLGIMYTSVMFMNCCPLIAFFGLHY
jgi:hypothetical protein